MTMWTGQLESTGTRVGPALDMRTSPEEVLPSVSRARQRRLFWLLTAAWLVNVFDLFFTQMAYNQSMLVEMNPVAAMILPYGPLVTALYKFTLLIVGTSILWWYRRHGLAEAAAWAYALVCVFLCFWWHRFNVEIIPVWTCLSSETVLSGT